MGKKKKKGFSYLHRNLILDWELQSKPRIYGPLNSQSFLSSNISPTVLLGSLHLLIPVVPGPVKL